MEREDMKRKDAEIKTEMLAHYFLLIYKQLYQCYNQFALEFEVTGTQMAALERLWVQDGCTVGELGEIIGIERSSVTGLVNRMVDNNLVVKAKDRNDRRLVRLYLTPKGKSIKEEKLKKGYSFSRMLGDFLAIRLDRERGTVLLRLLQDVHTALQEWPAVAGEREEE
jgi:DNA-binding MarR family transcriptional regulator